MKLPDCDYLKDNEPVEVGKYYKVLCAVMDGYKCKYWPVIGPIHKDQQLGVDVTHIHHDGRFVKNGTIYPVHNGITNSIINLDGASAFTGFTVKRMKCLRLKTGIKPPEGINELTGKPHAEKYWNWYKTMVGKSCKGKKCPHLGTTMHKRGGKLVCPLHNLTGCAKKEVIVDIKKIKILVRQR